MKTLKNVQFLIRKPRDLYAEEETTLKLRSKDSLKLKKTSRFLMVIIVIVILSC